MKNNLSEILGGMIALILFLLYFFGMYKIISDDHRYTTKDVVIGAVVFPYPWWVGSKELYRYVTVSSEDRAFESMCLDKTESMGIKRKMRLSLCECIVETRDENQCKKRS